ncbi:MAG: pyruvate kinase [Bacteroidetes bacterium]|nr:pyruvate kinase [Bacteroidota bacterium]MCL5267906.1 pyruvate kinase [Bacteroidota bacterium]
MQRNEHRKTKIICTLGPSSDSAERIRELVDAGADVFRLNFSHGTHEEHARHIDIIRRLEVETQQRFAIIQDLQGPKIRVGKLDNVIELKNGETVTLAVGDSSHSAGVIPVTYEGLVKDVVPGDRILMDDGLLELKAKAVSVASVECVVVNGGPLGSHKGINLPGVNVSIPSLTEKDKDDLRFGIENSVDFIALSFVRHAADVLELRALLERLGGGQGIIAKIEKPEAVDEIDSIIDASDAIMVARGDLGVEVPIEKVPILQKIIIRKCNEYGKPVITATQMLDSMIREPRPTRAEATDVANAVFDGTDAVMLSGETSAGNFPVEAVRTMVSIVKMAESQLSLIERKLNYKAVRDDFTDAIAEVACSLANFVDAAFIIPITNTGTTARALSKYRPQVPIFALTESVDVVRKLLLIWGVVPVEVSSLADTDAMLAQVSSILKSKSLASPGDTYVLTAGTPLLARGTTNTLRIERIL